MAGGIDWLFFPSRYRTLPTFREAFMSEKKWVNRFVFLETIAGVPGFIGALMRHLGSLVWSCLFLWSPHSYFFDSALEKNDFGPRMDSHAARRRRERANASAHVHWAHGAWKLVQIRCLRVPRGSLCSCSSHKHSFLVWCTAVHSVLRYCLYAVSPFLPSLCWVSRRRHAISYC